MNLLVNEVAELTGISIRTLHYYDKIGLLKPDTVTDAGYRLYSERNLETLQQILFFKELDFSLKEIREIMNNPAFDPTRALIRQQELLMGKRRRLDGLITLIGSLLKGDTKMSFKEFDQSELEEMKKKYATEAKERWGGTAAYEESEKKTAAYTQKDWEAIQKKMRQIFETFAALNAQGKAPDCKEAKTAVESWRDFISAHFYDCSKEILSSLGSMYVEDERFKKTLDECGEGTAEYLSRAIAAYCA